jgi:copper(I)-binding protein
MQIRKLTLAAIACVAFASSLVAPARADEVKAGDLVITQAWTRATAKGAKIGGGYVIKPDISNPRSPSSLWLGLLPNPVRLVTLVM